MQPLTPKPVISVQIESNLTFEAMQHDQHHDLVRKCLAGDRSSQFELYNCYAKAMYNTSLRLCGNREDAEDALQSAFVEVFHKLESYRFESSIGAWIKRIVINTSLNQIKKRRIFVDSFDDQKHDQAEEVIDHQGIAEENRWQVEAVRDAIFKLPDGYRTVLSLYLLEGFDHEEIGQVLNISEQTSKSQYSRARARLRDMLKPTMGHSVNP
jgi:RNA polymerase sigma factor (sigma-70 family)